MPLPIPATALISETSDPLAALPDTPSPAAIHSLLDAPPALVDAWPDATPFTLDGWFERSGFTPVWAGVLVFVLAFLAFQVIGGIAVAVGIAPDLLSGGEMPNITDTASLVGAYPHWVLGGNAIGQALAFGLVAWGAARLSTRRAGTFLRLRAPEPVGLALAVFGWVALYPVVTGLGQLNAQLPLPTWLQGLDEFREDMLTSLLLGGELSTLFLLVTIALTPALFEELLFRGYLQRQVERRYGTVASIVGVGIAFGVYHLTAVQVVPLAVLGIYMGFVVWATGSLWTGVLVHLLNNGLAVVVSGMARQTPGFDPEAVGEVGGPWYVAFGLALAGAALVAVISRALVARRNALTGGRPDAAPVPSVSLPSPPAIWAVPS